MNPNHATINAEAAVADPDSVFHHYRRLIELRKELPVIAEGDFTMLLEDDERVYAFKRSLDGVELFVFGNFSGDAVTVGDVTLGPWEGKALLSTADGLRDLCA